MGIAARSYDASTFALSIHSFKDWFGPSLLGPKDQPHLAPGYVSLIEGANARVDRSKAAVEASYAADFVNRTQGGMPPWAGPPGAPENRPPITPEQAGGDLLNWVA